MVKTNPKVFLDLEVDGMKAGRLLIELFADTTPMTAENFRCLCTGEKGMGMSGKPLHFKGSLIHHVVPDFIWMGGDFVNGDGSGSESIYGHDFPDENFLKSHDRPCILSMANSDPDTNGSQFQIFMRSQTILDWSHVVFGQVVYGLDVIKVIDSMVGTREGTASRILKMADCGQIVGYGSVPRNIDEYEGLGSVPAMLAMLHKLTDELRATHIKIAEMENILAAKAKAHQNGQ